ncbi:YiiD C-terminal domain-containing protein [Nocardioides yefusunii]|nr:YiiD C-terminal domain-containing protein [Nocardioides yefusunii]
MHTSVPILGAMGITVLHGDASRASVLLPLTPNSNHLGTIYAGSLMSAAECLGGSIGFGQGLDGFVPLVTRVEIDYLRPATTDVTASTTFSPDHQATLREDALRDGKARYVLHISLTDAHGVEVARAVGQYQLRKF